MGSDKHLVTSLITVRYRIEVSQYNVNVSPGAFVCHRCEFGVELLFLIEVADIGRSVRINVTKPKASFSINANICSSTE